MPLHCLLATQFWNCFNLDWLLSPFATQQLYPLHYHSGGSFCFSFVFYLLFLMSHNVFFPDLLPHLGDQCLPVAFCTINVWEVNNSLRSYLFENIFNLFFFLIGSLSGYWILCWQLFFFRILKPSIYSQCCFSEIWRVLSF